MEGLALLLIDRTGMSKLSFKAMRQLGVNARAKKWDRGNQYLE